MPSFTSRHYTPDRLQPFSRPEDDMMEDVVQTAHRPKATGSLTLGPSEGSLLDYFDLPSPPSTPRRPTGSLSFSSLNGFSSPAASPGLFPRGSPSSLSSGSSRSSSATNPSPLSSTSATPLRWPTASQRINRLPTRPRSRSTSSVSSSGSSTLIDVEMTGTGTGTGTGAEDTIPASTSAPSATALYPAAGASGSAWAPVMRTARRTPYYPPNASRNVDRTRVYMHRGPHFIPNWTPLSSLPRHVQLQIEEKLVRFTAG